MNQKLGQQGEAFIVHYERRRLEKAGKKRLSKAVRHASQQDDGLGYDIESFDEHGKPMFIEVKTTKFSRATPFWVTKNELETSRELKNQYFLYRVFNFNEDPRFFTRQGKLDQGFMLEPSTYMANVRSRASWGAIWGKVPLSGRFSKSSHTS